MDVGSWVAILVGSGGLVTGIVALVTMGAQRRKISAEGSKAFAEATQIVVNTGTSLLTSAEQKAERLETKLTKAEARIDELESSLAEANRTVNSLNDRLRLAQRLLTEQGIPFPPVQE